MIQYYSRVDVHFAFHNVHHELASSSRANKSNRPTMKCHLFIIQDQSNCNHLLNTPRCSLYESSLTSKSISERRKKSTTHTHKTYSTNLLCKTYRPFFANTYLKNSNGHNYFHILHREWHNGNVKRSVLYTSAERWQPAKKAHSRTHTHTHTIVKK